MGKLMWSSITQILTTVNISNEFKDYIGFSVCINDEDINSLLTDKPYLLLREQTKCLVCDNISAYVWI